MTARSSNASLCRFTTVYDVHLTPIAVAKVAFSSFCQVPPALPRPAEVNAMLSIDLECATPGMCFAQAMVGPIARWCVNDLDGALRELPPPAMTLVPAPTSLSFPTSR